MNPTQDAKALVCALVAALIVAALWMWLPWWAASPLVAAGAWRWRQDFKELGLYAWSRFLDLLAIRHSRKLVELSPQAKAMSDALAARYGLKPKLLWHSRHTAMAYRKTTEFLVRLSWASRAEKKSLEPRTLAIAAALVITEICKENDNLYVCSSQLDIAATANAEAALLMRTR